MRGHTTGVSVAVLLALGCVGVDAQAKPKSRPDPNDRANDAPLNVRPASEAAAESARAHASRGDCVRALDEFDTALRTSVQATLRRDRGLCHEQLGHPFPAIDDYRSYLTASPDAGDFDAIYARLARLEEQMGIAKPRGEAAAESVPPTTKTHASGELMSFGASGGSPETGLPATEAHTPDKIEEDARLDELATNSPLRRGKGPILGPYVGFRRYTQSNFAWGQTAGLALRYSVGPVSTILGEIGYSGVNSSGSVSSLGGTSIHAGYEARLALNARVSDALLLGATAGYERLRQGATGAVYHAFLPRARLGYRHTFGPSLGLEGTADGGLAVLHLAGGGAGTDTTGAILGFNVALVAGF